VEIEKDLEPQNCYRSLLDLISFHTHSGCFMSSASGSSKRSIIQTQQARQH
jgi:hypothetical protein